MGGTAIGYSCNRPLLLIPSFPEILAWSLIQSGGKNKAERSLQFLKKVFCHTDGKSGLFRVSYIIQWVSESCYLICNDENVVGSKRTVRHRNRLILANIPFYPIEYVDHPSTHETVNCLSSFNLKWSYPEAKAWAIQHQVEKKKPLHVHPRKWQVNFETEEPTRIKWDKLQHIWWYDK